MNEQEIEKAISTDCYREPYRVESIAKIINDAEDDQYLDTCLFLAAKQMLREKIEKEAEIRRLKRLLAKTQVYLIEIESRNPMPRWNERPQLIAEIAQVLGGR